MASKKSSVTQSDMTVKAFVAAALILAFVGGFFIARAKYKPQIEILTRMVNEKDEAMQKIKSNANKVMMKDGMVWLVEDGLVSEMNNEVVLRNGDKVMADGKVVKSDGTESTLQNGDAIDMEGNMMPNGGDETDTSGVREY